MKHSKKLVTLSVLTTMSGAAIYFLNKTLDTAAVRKNLLASAEKEIFSWQFGDIFYTKKGPPANNRQAPVIFSPCPGLFDPLCFGTSRILGGLIHRRC